MKKDVWKYKKAHFNINQYKVPPIEETRLHGFDREYIEAMDILKDKTNLTLKVEKK